MLFMVYPDGAPPVRKGPNPFLLVLAGCGGCAVLVVLAFVALGYFGVRAARPMMQAMEQMPNVSNTFLTDMRDHNYADAALLVAPGARQKLDAATLEKSAKAFEKKHGSLQSWKQSSPVPETNIINNMPAYVLKYLLTYQKGTATASFTFQNKDPLHPSTQISDFTVDSGGTTEPRGQNKGRD